MKPRFAPGQTLHLVLHGPDYRGGSGVFNRPSEEIASSEFPLVHFQIDGEGDEEKKNP